jgi:hypothetical protein
MFKLGASGMPGISVSEVSYTACVGLGGHRHFGIASLCLQSFRFEHTRSAGVRLALHICTSRRVRNTQLQPDVRAAAHEPLPHVVLVDLSGQVSVRTVSSVLLCKGAGRADAAVVGGRPVAQAAEVLVAVYVGRATAGIDTGVCRLIVVELYKLSLRGIRLRAL